ncbi:hypothetical protein M9H77_04252 [Catharanthus roseus]|uniref:Uncharacterized protein n=1 Tax=Catharanthus roseus TaxID=4058 RepID=A0ACC0CE08_CATRO|nr:hypothetical protein M9H77_04252 [Catharanthus roseus]
MIRQDQCQMKSHIIFEAMLHHPSGAMCKKQLTSTNLRNMDESAVKLGQGVVSLVLDYIDVHKNLYFLVGNNFNYALRNQKGCNYGNPGTPIQRDDKNFDMNRMSPSYEGLKLGHITRSQRKQVQLQEDKDMLVCIMKALKSKDGEFEGESKHPKLFTMYSIENELLRNQLGAKFGYVLEEKHPTVDGRGARHRLPAVDDRSYLTVAGRPRKGHLVIVLLGGNSLRKLSSDLSGLCEIHKNSVVKHGYLGEFVKEMMLHREADKHHSVAKNDYLRECTSELIPYREVDKHGKKPKRINVARTTSGWSLKLDPIAKEVVKKSSMSFVANWECDPYVCQVVVYVSRMAFLVLLSKDTIIIISCNDGTSGNPFHRNDKIHISSRTWITKLASKLRLRGCSQELVFPAEKQLQLRSPETKNDYHGPHYYWLASKIGSHGKGSCATKLPMSFEKIMLMFAEIVVLVEMIAILVLLSKEAISCFFLKTNQSSNKMNSKLTH